MPKKQPYPYEGIIKRTSTNEEVLSALMNYSRAGALVQGFVMQALRNYAQHVLDSEDDLREQMQGNPLISPEAWLQCATDVIAALDTANR